MKWYKQLKWGDLFNVETIWTWSRYITKFLTKFFTKMQSSVDFSDVSSNWIIVSVTFGTMWTFCFSSVQEWKQPFECDICGFIFLLRSNLNKMSLCRGSKLLKASQPHEPWDASSYSWWNWNCTCGKIGSCILAGTVHVARHPSAYSHWNCTCGKIGSC